MTLSSEKKRAEARNVERLLLISGTTRVFIQSAAIFTIALLMRDLEYTGSFRQSCVVAVMYLLPVPIEILASTNTSCGSCIVRDRTRASWISVGMVAITTCLVAFGGLLGTTLATAMLRTLLAVIAPSNVARLNQLRDSERSLIRLEWLKSYVGRFLGPLFALVVYERFGFQTLLTGLGLALILVARTA
jgi:hypothetical protein